MQAYLNMRPRTNAPHTPKILLLGPVGCGKSVQAALLANKYGLINGMVEGRGISEGRANHN